MSDSEKNTFEIFQKVEFFGLILLHSYSAFATAKPVLIF